MEWFQEEISEAIIRCKMTSTVLIVYIRGSDEDEQNPFSDAVWDDERLSQMVKESKAVALKLNVDSVEGKQFAQIYPVISVPCTFFISSGGVPLEVIPAQCQPDEFIKKAEAVLQAKPKEVEAHQSSDIAQAVEASGEPQISTPEVSEEVPVEASSTDIKAKVARANELIEKKKKLKAKEEAEKARLAEIERRKLGQDLEKLKQFQAEQEAKEAREAIRKEKEETRAAREKVRQQIEADRLARSAKYQAEKSAKEEELKKKQQEKLQAEAEASAARAAANSLVARIQFRMPDGSSTTNVFQSSDTLQCARDFIAMHELNPLQGSVRLAMIYPRRVFTEDDMRKTLRELGLSPSSALLLLPGTTRESSNPSNSSGGSLFSFLMAPLMAFWGIIYTFLFARPIADSPSQPQQQSPTPATTNTRQSGDLRRRVGRLSDLSPGTDDQNTWNGNSTQQQ